MDEKFEDFKKENKEFCEKADTYQQEILFITEDILGKLEAFRCYQRDFNKDYMKININKLVNELARIRSLINNLKWKDSKK